MGHQLTPLDFILCEVTHDKLIPKNTLKTVGAFLLINKLAAGCDPLHPSAHPSAHGPIAPPSFRLYFYQNSKAIRTSELVPL